MHPVIIRSSILSGLFASLASVFGKVATTTSICMSMVESLIPIETWFQSKSQYLTWIFQAVSFGLMILSNSFMWAQFSMALAHSSSTIQVTSINTVSNFIFSAIFGWMIFNEPITLTWTIGICCIVMGVILLKKNEHNIDHPIDKNY